MPKELITFEGRGPATRIASAKVCMVDCDEGILPYFQVSDYPQNLASMQLILELFFHSEREGLPVLHLRASLGN